MAGETTQLESPDVPGMASCLDFYFSLGHVGGVKFIKIKTISGLNESIVWSISNDYFESYDEWTIGQVKIKADMVSTLNFVKPNI